MKILIAGYGLIGRAIVSAFKKDHELVVVEPTDSFNEHNDSDGCIICVNAENSDGDFDLSRLTDIIDKLPIYMPIMIKSSLPPSAVDEINTEYPAHSIVISPDFSRELSFEQDFLNQQYVVIGGEDPECFWQDLFQSSLPNCKMVLNCSDKEAALVKYASTGLFATKASYFNQLYDVCGAAGLDFDIIRQILSADPRIGTEYTMVPGQDGTRGWSGKAFTRDINDFINWSNELEAPLLILNSITEYNDKIRKNY